MQVQQYDAAAPTAVAPLAPISPPARPTDPPTTPTPAGPFRPPATGLGHIVLPLSVLAIGVLGLIDLAGAAVSASAYVAVPLAIVGLGLVVRTWYGRGWSLAVFGAVLALALVMVTAAERVDAAAVDTSTWRPLTADQVDANYAANVGNVVLDLSAIDFTGQSRDVRVSLDAGNLTVVLPSEVDVQAEAQVNVGNGVVFGERWGGLGQTRHTITNLGPDGPGGGSLVLHATVNVGNLEVHR